jgi:hypothetical protein
MQMHKAWQLRQKWGNKPCDHPSWAREYYLGTNTGDKVCTQCGRDVDFDSNGRPIPSRDEATAG